MRGRAEAARRAHNPEVSGSNPLPATSVNRPAMGGFLFGVVLRHHILRFRSVCCTKTDVHSLPENIHSTNG